MLNETMGNQQVTQSEIGWLAGIIDGEGHIGISIQNRKRCMNSTKFDLKIVNTDYVLIDKVVAVMQKMGVNPLIRERIHIKATHNQNKIVTVGKMSQIKRIFDHVIPHLTGMKQSRATIMLELIESRLTKTQGNKYSLEELALVSKFRTSLFGSDTSTTIRETCKHLTA